MSKREERERKDEKEREEERKKAFGTQSIYHKVFITGPSKPYVA